MEVVLKMDRQKQKAYWSGRKAFLIKLRSIERRVVKLERTDRAELSAICEILGVATPTQEEWDSLTIRAQRTLAGQKHLKSVKRVYRLEMSHFNLLAMVCCYGTVDAITGAPLSKLEVSMDA